MKILFICQYYYPEPFRHKDICEELVSKGHEVTVITGLPNYPVGKVYKGYKYGKKRDEVINGVKIHRCFTIGRYGGSLKRLLNYFSYPLSACRYVGHIKKEYDIVFVNQLSPIMMAWPAIKYKKKHKTKIIMYCLDLWPISLCVGGMSTKSIVYKLFHKISVDIYKKMDLILNTSESFKNYQVNKLKIDSSIISYLPQYAETIFLPSSCKKLPNEFIDLMFAGNIGTAQSIKTIITAAKLCKDIKNLRWHIVGDGTEVKNLKNMAQGMENIIFYGYQPIDKMPEFYSMADVMLVTMKKDLVSSLTLPGKVQTYMAAGKPIIGAADGETQRVISESQCGFCGQAEDAQALAVNVRRIINEDLETLSSNSRRYYESKFSKESFFKTIESVLKKFGK